METAGVVGLWEVVKMYRYFKDKMDAVLEEIPRVRQDLGYPPLVTPTSQIVGTQAALNVLTGARYKSVTNEVKNYLLGRYGAAPGQVNSEVNGRSAHVSFQKSDWRGNHHRPDLNDSVLIVPVVNRRLYCLNHALSVYVRCWLSCHDL